MQNDRFTPSKKVIFIDRFMAHFIKIGGVGLIAAVLGIFLFIFLQILPLFQKAKIGQIHSLDVPKGVYKAIGSDEEGELPFLLSDDHSLVFLNAENSEVVKKVLKPDGVSEDVVASTYENENLSILQLTSTGSFFVAKVLYENTYEGEKKSQVQSLEYSPLFNLEESLALPSAILGTHDVIDLSFGWDSEASTAAFILKKENSYSIKVVNFTQSQSLVADGELEVSGRQDLASFVEGTPKTIRVSASGNTLVVATAEGVVYFFNKTDNAFSMVQKFSPFAEIPDHQISSMEYILGGVSLSFVGTDESHMLYSLLIPKGETKRLFVKTKEFDNLPSHFVSFSKSLRNKALLVSGENHLSLRYATTADVRLEKYIAAKIKLSSLSSKYDRILILDENNKLNIYSLLDPHPEGGWRAFFGKVWYEGASQPDYTWQSSGGSDSFEAKLSLIPLIIGTLKGTFYALLFAVPIALLAAVYTSEFLHQRYRSFIKPTLEIMASLPSVILGFLAALWLAPLVETKVPSILLVLLFLPVVAMTWGYFWSSLPVEKRSWLKEGNEVLLLIPVVVIGAILAWKAGPVLESLIFYVRDPQTGEKIVDFRKWWVAVTGMSFDQRNSLVVGFIMGFAVIPLIFTITDDSLMNVPRSLRSASLACGASRWQTTWKVILPAASAGIFSAIMIGFGRAVGETMIVLMATGNTPVMDWNIFSGMRTLSANLAVELPEAPFQGTLYRTLYLGAFVLFIITFVVNTIADLARQMIRKKYKML